jgi:serine/threonine protein kinase
MPEAIPRRIGRYDIVTLLGEGGMAQAYLAVSRGPGRFNKLAVIKRILPDLSQDPNFVEMFLDEARLTARLHHPNIVQTFDAAEHDGNYLLAMEYLDGLPLTKIYRRIHPRLLPLETHLWILTQILTGLHYAHTLCDYDGSPLAVVHRDINPANILVTYAGDVKVLDFGVAKVRGALAVGTEGKIKGKPAYCAPEQLRGTEPDARADVFAVGVMLWEILAGKRLNRAPSLVEAARARLGGKEPRIRDVQPDIDPALADICDRAMAMEPNDRFTTAAEFRIELQAHLDRLGNHGRRTLIERLEEVFSADRLELRRLIERRLSDQTPTPVPTSTIAVSPPPVPPPVPRSTNRARIAALAAVGVACVVVTMALLFRGKVVPSPATAEALSKRQSATSPSVEPMPPARPPAPPPAPVEIPKTDIPPPPSDEETPEAPTTVASSGAQGRKSHPARHSRAKIAAVGFAERATPQEAAAVAPRAPESPVVPSATSKQTSTEAAAAPGTHLVRPPRALHGTVDERDPYSP